MIIKLNKKEVQLLITSLSHYAEGYRRIANDSNSGYSPKSRQSQLSTAVDSHDLAVKIEEQLEDQNIREKQLIDQPRKIDPYDFKMTDWNPNDPRNW